MSFKGKRKSPPACDIYISLFKTPNPWSSSGVSGVGHVQQALQEFSVKESSSSKGSWKDVHLCSLLSSNVTLMLSSFPLSFSPFSLIHTYLSRQSAHSKPPGCSSPPPSLSLSVHLPLLLILSLHLKEQCTNLMLQLKGITFNKKLIYLIRSNKKNR